MEAFASHERRTYCPAMRDCKPLSIFDLKPVTLTASRQVCRSKARLKRVRAHPGKARPAAQKSYARATPATGGLIVRRCATVCGSFFAEVCTSHRQACCSTCMSAVDPALQCQADLACRRRARQKRRCVWRIASPRRSQRSPRHRRCLAQSDRLRAEFPASMIKCGTGRTIQSLYTHPTMLMTGTRQPPARQSRRRGDPGAQIYLTTPMIFKHR